jgi:hypothetical protein
VVAKVVDGREVPFECVVGAVGAVELGRFIFTYMKAF